MKASDIEKARDLTCQLGHHRRDIAELAKVPALPNGVHVAFRYQPAGDPKKALIHIDIEEGESEELRQLVEQILRRRRIRIEEQLRDLGVDPDA